MNYKEKCEYCWPFEVACQALTDAHVMTWIPDCFCKCHTSEGIKEKRADVYDY